MNYRYVLIKERSLIPVCNVCTYLQIMFMITLMYRFQSSLQFTLTNVLKIITCGTDVQVFHH